MHCTLTTSVRSTPNDTRNLCLISNGTGIGEARATQGINRGFQTFQIHVNCLWSGPPSPKAKNEKYEPHNHHHRFSYPSPPRRLERRNDPPHHNHSNDPLLPSFRPFRERTKPRLSTERRSRASVRVPPRLHRDCGSSSSTAAAPAPLPPAPATQVPRSPPRDRIGRPDAAEGSLAGGFTCGPSGSFVGR